MAFKAVLHDTDIGLKTFDSIWFRSKEEAEKAGEKGLQMYGGSHYTIEEMEEVWDALRWNDSWIKMRHKEDEEMGVENKDKIIADLEEDLFRSVPIDEHNKEVERYRKALKDIIKIYKNPETTETEGFYEMGEIANHALVD